MSILDGYIDPDFQVSNWIVTEVMALNPKKSSSESNRQPGLGVAARLCRLSLKILHQESYQAAELAAIR